MSIDRINARFLVPVVKPDPNKRTIRTEEMVLQYAEFNEETTKRLLEEAACYEVCNFNCYSYENDVYNDSHSSVKSYGVRVDKLASISSMCYSTNEPQADCLIMGGQFVGVVVKVVREGGNGWSNYRYENYAVLYTDGRISGSNTASYSFAGEESSRDDERTYTLHRLK